MKILFVDHASHLKTHSADFFLDILRESFDVDVFYYEKTYGFSIPQEKIDKSDLVIFWEFLYNRHSLGIPGKRCVFVPMYDNEWGSKWQWKRIAASGMSVISFCDAITRHAKKYGVKDILDLRYFPNPADFPQAYGEPKRVFLWERGEISLSSVKSLLPPSDGYVFDVKKANEFLPKEEYLNRLSKCEIVIAPRMKEGIGMAFLEAMAMGKCIVAHDDATMNEYIQDGKTGVLRDFNNPTKLATASDIANVRDNVKSAVEAAFERWQKESATIVPFIEKAANLAPIQTGSPIDMFRYMLFLCEGALYRARESTSKQQCQVKQRTTT